MYEYPFGNDQRLNLDWFLSEWKNLLAAWEAEKNGIEGALQAEIDRAEAALADVFAARDAAAQSAANALESKNAAAQSASDASEYLTTVRADANTASNAAQNAAQSESNAAESAQTALASKNAAGQSERNAAQSEANANSSKNAAAQSASDADASKSDAAQSAADALANKNAAAQSAEDAENAAASVEDSAQQIAANTNDIRNLKASIIGKSVAYNNAEDTHKEIAFTSEDYENSDYEIEFEAEVGENTGTNPNISFAILCRGDDNINATVIDTLGAENIVLPNVQAGYKIYAKISAVGNAVNFYAIGKNGSTKFERNAMWWFNKNNVRLRRITFYTNNTSLNISSVIKFKNGSYRYAY